jgi:hypothetical protein
VNNVYGVNDVNNVSDWYRQPPFRKNVVDAVDVVQTPAEC